ncbi:MAG: CDP-alcohol phosphatidyltransferase family protein [Candidatus Accumulibacter sp.]|jgi:CDP-diacylglycerol--glycerol-3-phosphate 3-phosphatidyltransferase|nr:CDP-alcohol phosphatidyltransferase family protein [Accumulibacter sp.]
MIVIPLPLTLIRLILGPLALLIALYNAPRSIFAAILIAGLLSDYFDGAIARRLGVARPWLRRLDSTVDIVFYVSIAAVAYILETATFVTVIVAIAFFIGAEAICIATSLIKFRSLPGMHCCSAKAYGGARTNPPLRGVA